jgi:hypothetical protein
MESIIKDVNLKVRNNFNIIFRLKLRNYFKQWISIKPGKLQNGFFKSWRSRDGNSWRSARKYNAI